MFASIATLSALAELEVTAASATFTTSSGFTSSLAAADAPAPVVVALGALAVLVADGGSGSGALPPQLSSTNLEMAAIILLRLTALGVTTFRIFAQSAAAQCSLSTSLEKPCFASTSMPGALCALL